MPWLDDLTAHLGKPLAASGGTNLYGDTCYVTWRPNHAEVIVNNRADRFEVTIRNGCGAVEYAQDGEPTDAKMRDLCVLAGLLPLDALDGAR